jgi:hydroxyacyl-ACP dehydratase HTD2-like protein with hotdog domain
MICTTTRRAGTVSSLFVPRRQISTEAISALDKWTASIVKQPLEVTDHFNPHHLANLYATLPTTASAPRSQSQYNRLHPGHHLVFFNASNPEATLRQDGSDANFGPPPPFSRRMWAGGSMRWSREYVRNTAIGTLGTARSQVVDVKQVGLNGSNPMVFVKQKIDIHHRHGLDAVSHLVEEERTHVYIPLSSSVKRSVKSGLLSFQLLYSRELLKRRTSRWST